MRYRLDFHPLVPIDLAEASAWYERQEPGVGLQLELEANGLFRHLSDDASFYSVRFLDIRRVNLPKFPYGIFYYISGQTVVVLGVIHGARDTEKELARRRKAYD